MPCEFFLGLTRFFGRFFEHKEPSIYLSLLYSPPFISLPLLILQLEKKVKLAAAKTEKAWDGVGKEEGMRVWRIESFKVVEWPKEQYGNFFSGDSYIVLRVCC